MGFESMPLPLLPLPLGLVTRGPQKPVLGEFHPYQILGTLCLSRSLLKVAQSSLMVGLGSVFLGS
jgi:hypothetical protein